MQLSYGQGRDIFPGTVAASRYPYRLFLLVSFLFHLSIFFLIQHWVTFNGPVVENAADLIELVSPEALGPFGSLTKKRDAILFGTESLADLESLPRGEETHLPPIPKSRQPGIPVGVGPGESDRRGGGGTLLRQAKSSPPVSPSERVTQADNPPSVNPQKMGPMQEDLDGPASLTSLDGDAAVITPDSPFVSSRGGDLPDAANASSLPSLPPGRNLPRETEFVSRRMGESDLFSGGMPGLPLADGGNLDRLARVFTAREHVSKDPVAINTEDLKYFSYLLKMKNQIGSTWSYPVGAADVGLEGDLLVRFTVRRDGVLRDVAIVSSSGHDLLDREAIRAVEVASPYPPLPDAWQETDLTITGHFIYHNRLTYLR